MNVVNSPGAIPFSMLAKLELISTSLEIKTKIQRLVFARGIRRAVNLGKKYA